MPLPEAVRPVRMTRVALVAPVATLRDVLVRVADAGTVEFDPIAGNGNAAAQRLRGMSGSATPRLSPTAPDLDDLVRAGRTDLLAGEAAVREYADGATRRGEAAALLGWCPAPKVTGLADRLRDAGGALVPLPRPGGVDPPTMLPAEGRLRRSFAPLVRTYGTVAYRDLDPTWPAAAAYVLMFGMMFGDAGHGVLLVAIALLLRFGRWSWLARVRRAWPFVAGAGVAAIGFGLLYGEFFGPTGVVPVLWLAPLDAPVPLLVAAVGAGAVLLAVAYAAGIVNRWREGGMRHALYAPSGIAGSTLFLGLGGVAAGLYLHVGAAMVAGGVLAALGLGLAAVQFAVSSGGGFEGLLGVVIEMVDLVIRLGSNLVSFARLAAFGLTHAALGWLFWRDTVALAHHGGWGVPVAALVFLAGTAVAFSLAALVAAVQALRLEYYELFSRVFEGEGRPFRPWHVPLDTGAGEEART